MKHERIEVNPRVMVGKPVIKGTRIPVEQVLRELAGGMKLEDIIDAHPRLTANDIYAVISYAADVIANEDIYLSEPSDAISR
jgi:uncharacterized protein (DUF433 family)